MTTLAAFWEKTYSYRVAMFPVGVKPGDRSNPGYRWIS